MKTNKFFLALAMGLAVVACTPKAEPAAENQEGEEAVAPAKTLSDVTPTKAEKDSVAYLLGVYFGSIMKGDDFGDDLNFNLIKKGVNDFLAAKGTPRDSTFGKQFKIDPVLINQIFPKYLDQRRQMNTLKNQEKEAAFFAKLDKDGKVLKTESGLRYEIVEAGNQEIVPTTADTVYVHYKLTLPDGNVLDQVADDAEPARMPLSANIKGFQEGLGLIGEGGKIKLYIPSELGYGAQGARGAIEPYSYLTFDVTLDKVGKAAAAEEE
ncbi:MAG: FKBP-type peptidyl-prolyl cis-trans isomerase [Bacteroidales bacterium]|nr:FKBP-type peptidyl-prolyl cis-trans isomerase [Bacteroidales bacterium]